MDWTLSKFSKTYDMCIYIYVTTHFDKHLYLVEKVHFYIWDTLEMILNSHTRGDRQSTLVGKKRIRYIVNFVFSHYWHNIECYKYYIHIYVTFIYVNMVILLN